nr:amidohydrolase [Anaerotalea alkaliphila]
MLGVSQEIWSQPELSMEESRARDLQQEYMVRKGFKVEGVPGMETAFVATYGTGKVKVGFLGEYDALPGLSQAVSTSREPLVEGGAGHGCGHNLIGTGALAAALGLQALVDEEGLDCTVRYYGCPGEEMFFGKVEMIRKGVFEDLDFCLTWHPFDVNKVWTAPSLANMELSFRFSGIPSHAADSPHMGRSALDAVELMHVGVNYLREHVPDQVRIHYVITEGGQRANIVPAFAASKFNVRAPGNRMLLEIVRRVLKVARGAALMTETEMDYSINTGLYDFKSNRTLGRLLQENCILFPLPGLEEEEAFFREIGETVTRQGKEDHLAKYHVDGFEPGEKPVMDRFDPSDWSRGLFSASTDVGDVSWVKPTGQLMGAAWALGVEAHTWQATACSGTRYAARLAVVIGKILAKTAGDAVKDPGQLARVKEDFAKDTEGFRYRRMDSYRDVVEAEG